MVRRVAAIAALAAGTAGIAGTARATTVTCPTVTSGTGVVTPAPSPGVDWSGCDLSGANLNYADLTNANLSGANVSDASLGATILQGTDFAGADLYNTGLSSAQIVNANFTNTNLELDVIGNATITGTDLTGADISQAYLVGSTLTGIKSGGITDSNGIPTFPKNWGLSNGYLVGPGDDFSGVDFPALANAPNLTNWDLTGSTFAGANLTGVDLYSDTLTNAQFAGANLTSAYMYADVLTGANLQGAVFTGADLTAVRSGQVTGTPAALPANWSLRDGYLLGPGAELGYDNLAGMDLTGADLAGANLGNSSLANANLTNVNFHGAFLDQADFTGATWSNTTCPDGTNSDNDGGTCAKNIDDQPPAAHPTISGTPGANGWYTSAVTVTWNWTDTNNTSIDPSRCPATTTTAVQGHPTVVTATCYNMLGAEGSGSASVNIEHQGPTVAVTGVAAGRTYPLGHVPAAGCRTTDAISGVGQAAAVSVTTSGSHGVGSFTATCAGASNNAGIVQAAPVRTKYVVAYGMSGFLSPKNGTRVARSGHVVTVTFRLAGITASLAAKLAAAGGVRVTLSGPGISAVTVKAAWQAKTGTFGVRIPIPAKVKTGVNYAVTVRENVGTGLVVAPALGKAVNPESIRFS